MNERKIGPREAAARTLFAIDEQGAWSDGALHRMLDRARLSGRDAALTTRLVYGTMQNRLLCDWYLRAFSTIRLKKIAPRVRTCLQLGLYQLLLMDRMPAHAVVDEMVALVRQYAKADTRAAGFANAVLRHAAQALQQGTLPVLDCPDKPSYYSLRYSHPLWLVELLCAQYGQKQTEQICQANNALAPLSVRVNRLRCTPQQARTLLEQAGLTVTAHEKMDEILLCAGGDVSRLAAFVEGKLTVQDAASAVAAHVLGAQPDCFVLDCCAAPGGKSFAIAEGMGNRGRVVACDLYEHKVARIAEGAARLGLSCIQAVQQDARVCRTEWCGQADYVLCDVPCSGLGIIRKKPEIRYKNPEELRELPALQQQILQNCAQYVKVGGVLVYSTCTIVQRENEQVVRTFLAGNPQFTLVPWTHPVCGEVHEGYLTLLPHVHRTDGFFVARMVRTA